MSILLDKPVSEKSKSIVIPVESYLYLKNYYHHLHSGTYYNDEMLAKLKHNYEQKCNNLVIGLNQLIDGDFNMSISSIKKLLDDNDLPYEDGEDVEYISV